MTQFVQERWVGVNEGRRDWATAASEVLTEVASHYEAVITHAVLAEQVQLRTKLRTQSHSRNWIGSVLAQVVTQCKASGLPPLGSLVSQRPDGGIDPDQAVVRARLACYRRFADDVPAEVIAEAEATAAAEAAAEETARGRRAKPRTKATTSRASARTGATGRSNGPRAAATGTPVREEPEPAICPTCFMQRPLSGICDSCG